MAEHSFVVASTLEVADAFARLVDLERVTEWDDGIISSTRTGHDIGGDSEENDDSVIVGRTFDVVVTGFDGAPTTMVYEITESDSASRFVMVGIHPTMRAVDTLELAAKESGCELAYHGVLELLGDDPPLTDAQLDRLFPRVASVAERGLTAFLNP